jgi:hypothetical protein
MTDGAMPAIVLPKPPANIRPPRLSDVWQMCANLRPDEIEQYMALSSADAWDFEEAARKFDRMMGPKICLHDTAGAPIMVAGWEPLTPGCYDGWMIGTTDGWAKHALSITRATRWGMDYLMASGARRLQIATLADRHAACAWYEHGLKMREEGTQALYGRHGEDVTTYVRLRSANQ